jgi:hypothetical protein
MFVYMLTGEATAEVKEYPAGERHSLLVFVRGDDPAHGEADAIHGCEHYGWTALHLMDGKDLGPSMPEGLSEVLAGAWESALEHGVALVAFGDSDEPQL